MTDFKNLFRQTRLSDSTQLTLSQDDANSLTTKKSGNFLGRLIDSIKLSHSSGLREENRATIDAYVRELHAVNSDLGQVASQKLNDDRLVGRPLTLRKARDIASNDLLKSIERQTKEIKSEFISRGVFGPGKTWAGTERDDLRLKQLRQSIELVASHLSEQKNPEALGKLQTIGRQLDQLRGLKVGEWVVPEAQLQKKGQRRLEVFNTATGKFTPTHVSQGQWKALTAAYTQQRDSKTPCPEDRDLRRTAMQVIKATGETRGIRFLERAPTSALIDLARQVGFGIYNEFDDLHDLQAEIDSKALDASSLALLQKYNANRSEVDSKLEFAHVKVETQAASKASHKADPFLTTPKEVKALRAFYAECLSPTNLVELETMSTAERLKKACISQPTVFLDLLEHQELLQDPQLSQIPPEFLEGMIDLVPDSVFEELKQQDGDEAKMVNVLKSHFDKQPPQAFESFGKNADVAMKRLEPLINDVMRQLSSEFGGVPGNTAKFLSEAFTRYYAEQAPMDQKSMLASFMRNAVPESAQPEALAALIKGAGPYMIKMLQMVADNIGDKPEQKEIKEALAFVKTGLPSIHPDIRNAMLASVISDSNGTIASLKQVKSLGAASVGEAFLTNIEKSDGSKQQVVIKLLRPGIQERAGRERIFMDAVAHSIPGMAGTFEGIADQIEGEMDLRTEAANVRLASVYDQSGDPDVRSMKLVDSPNQKPFYMLIEKAPGSTVSHHLASLKNSYYRNETVNAFVMGMRLGHQTSAMAEKWVEEALFGSGFYHGDLHAGNMMFAPTEDGPNGVLTVIDFGNSKVLAEHERQAIFKMMLTATLNEPKLFCENFESILSPEAKELMTPATREAFTQDIAKIMSENRDAPGKAIGKILDAANERYIEVPGPISNFSRSELMLENTLAAISEANTSNWASYKSKMENLPTETAKAQKAFDSCLTATIRDAEAKPGSAPQLLEQLKAMQSTPYLDLSDEQVATLLEQGDPLRNLTLRLGQITQLANETFVTDTPPPFSIDQAISNVLARHKSDAFNLAGTSLAVRAAAGLAV